MNRRIILAAALIVCNAASSMAEESMEALTKRVFDLAESQFVLLDTNTGEGRVPKSLDTDGALVTAGIGDWISGFFPGSLWLTYEYTGSGRMKDLAMKRTLMLQPLLDMKVSHDIGFQIGCSYGNALRITSDAETYRPAVIRGAEKLADRFVPAAGVTRSWDWGAKRGWDTPVIIDNMMNLQLLMDACRPEFDERFYNVAVSHANATIAHHFRPDYTCYHVVDYDSRDGSVRRRQTHQGYSDESTWARGEAWALYGFTMMYMKTGDEKYFMQADYVSKYIIRNLPEDGIPYWDFDRPGEYRDASAAAVMASAFVQLYEVTGRKHFLDMADKQIRTLASGEYLAAPGSCSGFLLKHSVGSLPAGKEVDVPLSYADYYFLEALIRRQRATSHPRLFLDDKTWEGICSQLGEGSNKALARIHETIMKEAENLPSDTIEWKLDASGKRILGQARTGLKRLMFDAYAYRFSSEKRFLDHAVKTMEELCAMPDWNGWHFLDVAEMAAALAIGYDWLYDDLSPELKGKLVKAIDEYAFTEAFDMCKAWFYDKPHNWNQVCNGGLAMAALAFREDCGAITGNIIRNAVKTNRRQLGTIYGPDGCYPEGAGYWNYGNTYQILMNGSFDSALGDDFGLSLAKGFDRAGDFVQACYGADGKMFNYYDNALEQSPAIPIWYFAWRFGKPRLLVRELEFLESGGGYFNKDSSILPVIMAFASRLDTDNQDTEPGGMYVGHGNNPIATVRGKGNGSEWYLGVKGGMAANNHAHMDAGSFVFDRDGVRWAADPGLVKYTKAENELKSKGGDFWDRGQKSMRWEIFPIGNEWHNTLTVNGRKHVVNGFVPITRTSDTDELKLVTADLTALFSPDLASAVRTFVLEKGRKLTITDRIEAARDSRVCFTLVSEGSPEIGNGRIVLRRAGKKMTVKVSGADVSIEEDESAEAKEKGLSVIRIGYDVKASETSVVKVVME